MSFAHLRVRSQSCPMRGMVPLQVVADAGRGGGAAVVTDRNLWAQVKLAKLCAKSGARLVHAAEVEVRWGAEPWQRGCVALLARSAAGWRALRALCSLATPAACDLQQLAGAAADGAGGLVLLTGGCAENGGLLHSAWRAGGWGGAQAALQALREAGFDGGALRAELAPTMGDDWRALDGLAASEGVEAVATADASYPAPAQRAAWEVLRAVAEKRRLQRGEAARRAESPAGRWGHLASEAELRAFFGVVRDDAPDPVTAAALLAEECAAGCAGAMPLGRVTLPDFVDDSGAVLDRPQQQALLARTAAAGLEERLARGVKGGHPPEAYRERLASELAMIERMGFAGYFLVVEEFCRWARGAGVPLGPGRGSAAGSLVVWCCGITDLDPVEHGLFFERFLNPSRVSWPDIDTDICKLGRPRVVQHLKDRYGAVSVGRIISYKALQGKTSLKDVGRALGISYFRLNAVCSGAPNLVGGKAPTVAWMLGKKHEPECAEARRAALQAAAAAGLPAPPEPACACGYAVPALRDAVDSDPLVAECAAHAAALEGCVRESGVHASGVVVSRGPLADWTPTCLAKERGGGRGPGAGGRGGELCSQWAMEEVEDAGLVKLDVLGLSTVTHLDLCLKLVEERRTRDAEAQERGQDAAGGGAGGVPGGVRRDEGGGRGDMLSAQGVPEGDRERRGVGPGGRGPGVGAGAPPRLGLASIPLDDAETYATVARGDTLGVFQMGKTGMRRMLRALRPDRFADLSAAVALYRPGPLGSKMTEGYIERKHGRERVEALHPSVDAVLAETYATVCYQEQTMAVIRTLSGCSLADADLIRKIMGKKKPELLAKERAKFMAGVARAGVCDAPVAERAWGVVEASSMYSFNKSHSVAYAFLAYWTAYLKVRHPVEFYSAWMTVLCGEADKSAKVAAAVYDARAHGVEVLPPCARESAAEFAPAGGAVRFGLGALRGLGAKCCASLLQERAAAPLASMVDLLRRCHATKRDLAALVGSGACDDLLRADGWTRHQALAHLGELAEWARRAKAAPPRPKPAPVPRAVKAPARASRTAAARTSAAQPTLPGVAVDRPAMGPAEVLDTLVHWVAERERARARKESGAPPPWTADPVIAAWRFCNVDRCDDRETRWIFQNVSAAHRDSPSLWFNLAVARFVNWSPTLAELGYFEEWDEGGFVQVMRRLEGEGRKVWTGAYMIPAGPPGVPKALFLARSVFTPLWESRGQRPPRGAACSDWDAFLRRVPCMGDFLRNQVITDMKYTADLEGAPDWGTFALAGPGTQRGLSRLAGEPLSKKWRQADAAAALAALRAVLLERLARPGYEDLAHLSRAMRDMNNLANCLCELDKYCRVVLGEGKPRSRYAPARP